MTTDLAVSDVATPAESIAQRIYVMRGVKAMLDMDLAELYGVETKALNRAVKRNLARFPDDFMFQLTAEEYEQFSALTLRCQFGTSKTDAVTNDGRGGRRYLPYAFTEQGVAMLSSVLSSPRAVQVNIVIMRAFVRLREVLSSQSEFAHRLEELERKVGDHGIEIEAVFDAIRGLMDTPNRPKRQIGFQTA